MKRGRLVLGIVMAAALAMSARPAGAGVLSKRYDILYITPFVGAEIIRFGSAELIGLQMNDFVTVGPAVGGTAGVRLGPLSVGALFQYTSAKDAEQAPFSMKKIYAELGFNATYGFVNVPVHLDFGYAYLSDTDVRGRGPGGKVGIAVDLFPVRVVSIGVGADFDFQAYFKDTHVAGGYGGTFTARFGLHL